MDSNAYLQRSCPSCGASGLGEDAVCSSVKAENSEYANLVPQWNGFFKEKSFFSYFPCTNCGLLYAPVFFTAAQVTELYGQMPPNMQDVPVEGLRRTQLGYFEHLRKHARMDGGLVEIGPDVGFFTGYCVQHGQFDNFWLFEPNAAVHGTLGEVVKGRPSRIISDMFGYDIVPNGSVSVAAMIHVLDHLLDPVKVLDEIKSKLRPDGILLIVTHDESSLLRKIFGAGWPAFCLQHPQLFNPASMTKMLAKAGMRVVDQKKTVNHFQIRFLLRHLLWALGIRVNVPEGFLSSMVGLKLGNLLTLAIPQEK